MNRGKFEVFTGKDKQFYFRLKAGNGKVILQSEGYQRMAAAAGGIHSVNVNALIEERFEFRTSIAGTAYFILKASNGREIGRSQMYQSLRNAKKGKSVIANIISLGPRVENLS